VRMVLDTNILIAALITKGTPPDSLESSSLTGLHSGEAFPPGIGDAIRVAALEALDLERGGEPGTSGLRELDRPMGDH
jgi:hypothetical protein